VTAQEKQAAERRSNTAFLEALREVLGLCPLADTFLRGARKTLVTKRAKGLIK
jgi:hypothetical protein